MNELTFGSFVRQKRMEKEMSLRSLAQRLELSPVYMSNIENGKTKFSLQVLTNVAETLSVTPNVLLVGQVCVKGKTRGLIVQEIDQQLSSCDEAQMFVIEEMVHNAKKLLAEYEKKVKKLK